MLLVPLASILEWLGCELYLELQYVHDLGTSYYCFVLSLSVLILAYVDYFFELVMKAGIC